MKFDDFCAGWLWLLLDVRPLPGFSWSQLPGIISLRLLFKEVSPLLSQSMCLLCFWLSILSWSLLLDFFFFLNLLTFWSWWVLRIPGFSGCNCFSCYPFTIFFFIFFLNLKSAGSSSAVCGLTFAFHFLSSATDVQKHKVTYFRIGGTKMFQFQGRQFF